MGFFGNLFDAFSGKSTKQAAGYKQAYNLASKQLGQLGTAYQNLSSQYQSSVASYQSNVANMNADYQANITQMQKDSNAALAAQSASLQAQAAAHAKAVAKKRKAAAFASESLTKKKVKSKMRGAVKEVISSGGMRPSGGSAITQRGSVSGRRVTPGRRMATTSGRRTSGSSARPS